MKTVVLYSKKHAESVASAAIVKMATPGAIVVSIDASKKEISEALKGETEVYLLVDGIDERHLKSDTVHYQEKAKKGPRRVVVLYSKFFPESNLPKILYHVAEHLNHDAANVNAGIVATLSDLNDNTTWSTWMDLLNNNIGSIDQLKLVGDGIIQYDEVISADEDALKAKEEDNTPDAPPAADDNSGGQGGSTDDVPEKHTKEELDKMKVDDLRKLAKGKASGISKMKKKELVKLLS